MIFWILAAAMALVVGGAIALTVLKGRDVAPPAAAFDLSVYRAQLEAIEKDRERGTLSPEDYERARIEISRKILEADKRLASEGEGNAAAPPKPVNALAAAGAVVAVLAGGLGLYAYLGAPGAPDMPYDLRLKLIEEKRANRPDQATAEQNTPPDPNRPAPDPKVEQLVDRLRQVVKARLDDTKGLGFLVQGEAALGNYRAAYEAQRRLLEKLGPDAPAEEWVNLAELMILAAGGYVSPEAERALMEAMKRDPKNGRARYYAGLMFAQGGRPDLAFRFWRALLEEGPPDAPWIAPIRDQIQAVAEAAGERYTPPPAMAMPGPDAGDVAAAAGMTDAERQDMIRGMVGRLAERLATEGGSAAEWARLIRAYGVLGETEKARKAWADAQAALQDDPAGLDSVREAARGAGVAE